MLEDVLGWAAVLAGSVLMYFTNLSIFDPLLSIAISIYIFINVFRNIKQILPILLQGTPRELEQEHIVDELKQIENIAGVHDLHIWSLDEEYNVLTVHITLEKTLTMEELAEMKKQIRAALKEEEIQHATIEFETNKESCEFLNCI